MFKYLLPLIFLCPLASMAVTKNTNLQATAKLEGYCSISANDVNFGTHTLTPSQMTMTLNGQTYSYAFVNNVTFTAKCSKNLPFTVKTKPAQRLENPFPLYTAPYFTYIFPMYHLSSPDSQFIGFNLHLNDPSIRVGTDQRFGDGTTTNTGVKTSYIGTKGTGNPQTLNFVLNYYFYGFLKPGTYGATVPLTIEY